MKINSEHLDRKEKLLKEQNNAVQGKKKKSKSGGPSSTPSSSKDGAGKRSGVGSANTSRASTPVSERSFKVTPAIKRGPIGINICF